MASRVAAASALETAAEKSPEERVESAVLPFEEGCERGSVHGPSYCADGKSGEPGAWPDPPQTRDGNGEVVSSAGSTVSTTWITPLD